jgi:nucleoside-diphosphate-sugar epimerase
MSDTQRTPTPGYWSGKRVMVTGGGGFLGRHVVARLTGLAGEIRWDATKPDGQPRRALNTDRARQRFGFTASTSFEEGLRQTIAWYEAHRCSVLGMKGCKL